MLKKESKKLEKIAKIITIIYTICFIGPCILFGQAILDLVSSGLFGMNGILSLLIFAVYLIPYILLYLNIKKDNKLLIPTIVCELLLIILIVVFFLVIWPSINSSICNPCWNDINQYNENRWFYEEKK